MPKESFEKAFKKLTPEKKKENRKRFRAYVFKYKWYFLLIIFSTILMIAQASIVPKLTQMLIDDWLPNKPGDPTSNEAVRAIIGILCGIGGLILIKATATFISTYIIRKFQQNIEMDLKLEMFEKIQKLEVGFFDEVNEGFFMGRMMMDTTMAAEYARMVPENALNVLVSFAMNFTFMFTFSWIIGISTMAVLVIMFTYTILARKKFRQSWHAVKQSQDKLNQFLVNSFAGIRETKAYTNEKLEAKKYGVIADEYKGTWRNNFLLYGKWMTVNTLILSAMTLTILSIGSYLVVEGTLTIGELTALTMYGGLIVEPINKLLAIFDLYMRGSVSLDRIFNIIDEDEEKYAGTKFEIKKGKVEFRNATLKYKTGEKALDKLNLKIEPGQKIALVGETGSGKSTIIKAMMRFYKLNSGSILIDGKDINSVNLKDLRRGITLMSQEPYLLFDSVANNIGFGIDINEENKEVYNEAVKNAQAYPFISKLPEKDKTNIGPRGVSLSGGQKQRVSLARALMRDTKILLFDEATSALDNETELKIKKELERLTKDKTVIYIAHRLTTIENVDIIFVISNGRVVEHGSHKELMNKKGHYYKLAKSV